MVTPGWLAALESIHFRSVQSKNESGAGPVRAYQFKQLQFPRSDRLHDSCVGQRRWRTITPMEYYRSADVLQQANEAEEIATYSGELTVVSAGRTEKAAIAGICGC